MKTATELLIKKEMRKLELARRNSKYEINMGGIYVFPIIAMDYIDYYNPTQKMENKIKDGKAFVDGTVGPNSVTVIKFGEMWHPANYSVVGGNYGYFFANKVELYDYPTNNYLDDYNLGITVINPMISLRGLYLSYGGYGRLLSDFDMEDINWNNRATYGISEYPPTSTVYSASRIIKADGQNFITKYSILPSAPHGYMNPY